ncbi:MAG: mechanosensitive ion channel family protein, partial [Acidobacteriota bacterium]
YYLFNIGVAYKEDTDHVVEVLKELGDEMMQDKKFKPLILAPLEVLGVDQFGDSAVVIKARFKTVPIQQWAVGREMNRRIKKRFDELGIEIPFPHRSIYWGEASKPFAIRSQEDREELKSLVREVLAEHSGQSAPKQEEGAQPKGPETNQA